MRIKTAAVLLLGAIVMATPQISMGYDFTIADEIDVMFKADLTYALRVRTEYPNWTLMELQPSSGNSNFAKGDLVNNKVLFRYEVQAYYSNLSLFVRGDAFYDDIFNDDRFNWDARQHAQYNFYDGMEYFLEGTFGNFSFRVGRQVVNWGESIAPVFAVAVNTVSPFFGARIAAAGYTARDFQVPSHMIWANYELTPTLSLEGVWNPDFEPRLFMPVAGTFQSFSDALGYGQDGSVDDQRPTRFEDQQQGGVALRKIFPSLKYFELGLYYYHHLDRAPAMTFDLTTMTKPVATYPEMDMFGLSFAHAIDALQLQIQGELAYRPNDTLQKNFSVDDIPPGLPPALKDEIADQLVGVPIGGVEIGNTLNWVFGGSRLWSDVLPFTPWTFSLLCLYEFYGSWNIDHADSKHFTDPENTYFYFVTLPLTVADLIDNTTLTLQFDATGNLHESQRSLHRFSYSLKAKYGDHLEALFGFDMPVGKAEENAGPNNMSDRDVFTFALRWYFI